MFTEPDATRMRTDRHPKPKKGVCVCEREREREIVCVRACACVSTPPKRLDRAKKKKPPHDYGRTHTRFQKTLCSLFCHEKHAEHLADASKTTRVDLADVYRVRLEELLEHHPIMRVLARRDADPMRFQPATDGRMSKDIVRRRWLLD